MSEKQEKSVESNAKKRTLVALAAGALALATLGYVAINRSAPEAATENDDLLASLVTREDKATSEIERTQLRLMRLQVNVAKTSEILCLNSLQATLAVAVVMVEARQNIDFVAENIKSIKVAPFASAKDEKAPVKYFIRLEFADGSVRYYDDQKVGGYSRDELSAFAVVGEADEDKIPEFTTTIRQEAYHQFGIE
ncbi:MAG: hypothetical protein J6K20_07050 [Thermoguttaceae bacterium]|nr:hypothetical protein [Thermoguttaceae bacterium]